MINEYIDLPILPLQSIDNVPRTARAVWTWGTCLTEATRDRLLAAYPEAIWYDLLTLHPDANNSDTSALVVVMHGFPCVVRGRTPARYLIINPRIAEALG